MPRQTAAPYPHWWNLRVRQIAPPIQHASLRSAPPPFATRSKLTPSQAKGKTYERKVGKELRRQLAEGTFPEGTKLLLGPWIDFADSNGIGLAQPDAILLTPTYTLIIEVKLKQSPKAHLQLEGLYAPLVAHLWPAPLLLLQVFKFPTEGKMSHRVDGPSNFLANPRSGVQLWHYYP